MPNVGTILAVLVFVVPGYMLRSGYLRSRARTLPGADLYVLAEAVAGSVCLFLAMWFWQGEEIVGWAEEGSLLTEAHRRDSFWFFTALFLGPWPLGLVWGWFVVWSFGHLERLRRRAAGDKKRDARDKAFSMLEKSGLIRHSTVWDDAWLGMRSEKRFWVRITTSSGKEIVGLFADKSRVGTSPAPRQVYLEYAEEPAPRDSKRGRGVYVNADEIETVEFASYD